MKPILRTPYRVGVLAVAAVLAGLIAILGGCSGSPQSSQVLPSTSAGQRAPSTRAEPDSEVSLWASLPSTNQLLRLSRDGQQKITEINTAANNCYVPEGVKVDHRQTLWVACKYDTKAHPPYGPGEIQAYAPGSSSPAKRYLPYVQVTAKCGRRYICFRSAHLNDVAFDTKGHVFAANLVTATCYIGPHGQHSCTDYPGWSWWRATSPKSAHIEAAELPDTYFYYLDVDATGALYITGTSRYIERGSQVFEITDPTGTSPGVTSILGPTRDHLGGVYVSNRGKVLNIVDETARTISQYALPWVTSELPFNVLGPTLQESDKGQPISGGFDLSETRLALGDGVGWLDLGAVAENKWTVAGKKNFGSGTFGAAYVPSDK